MKAAVEYQSKMNINQMIISAFPGTGKTSYCNLYSDYIPDIFASDSDSSNFDKSEFPRNYIEHIKQKKEQGYYRIFVSSHKEVRDALVENGLEFTLVYPKKELKDEYIKRYKERGSSEDFINLISENWENWIDELQSQKGCRHIQLETNQFLSNVF